MWGCDQTGRGHGRPGARSGRRGRVLIVEDNWQLADMLADLMVEHGFEVVGPVPRGTDALPFLDGEPLLCALLDIDLGRHGNSFALADALTVREVPFVFLTGYSSEIMPRRFRGVPRLSKPFDPEKILDVVSRPRGVMNATVLERGLGASEHRGR